MELSIIFLNSKRSMPHLMTPLPLPPSPPKKKENRKENKTWSSPSVVGLSCCCADFHSNYHASDKVKFEFNFGFCVFLALPPTFRSGKIVLLYSRSTVSTTLRHTIEWRRISNVVCQSPAFKVIMFSQGH